MPWTTPRTFVAGETVTASMLNTHIRDNLNMLLEQTLSQTLYMPAGAYTTTSTTFADVDSTNLKRTIAPISTRVLVMAMFTAGTNSGALANAAAQFDINNATSSARLGHTTNGLVSTGSTGQALMLFGVATGLTAGTTYDFRLQYRSTSGSYTTTVYAYPVGLFCWSI